MTESAKSFAYIETTLPAGMTIPAYRSARPQRVRGWHRIVGAVSRTLQTPATRTD